MKPTEQSYVLLRDCVLALRVMRTMFRHCELSLGEGCVEGLLAELEAYLATHSVTPHLKEPL